MRSSTPFRAALPAAAALIGVALLALAAPWPARLGAQRAGDLELAATVARLAGEDQRRGIAVAVLERGRLRTAGLGAAEPGDAGRGDAGRGRPARPDIPFQIGSVTKTFTGALFAVLIADGTVRPDDRLRDVLPDRPWRDPVGDITLAQLAGQRSGLPSLRLSFPGWARASIAELTGSNPYGEGAVDILAEANAAAGQTGAPGTYGYSNLGFALLGEVLAAKVGLPYDELLRTRVLAPLGLTSTTLPAPAQSPPAAAAVGHDVIGRQVADWNNPGWTPAGSGVWSTVGDLVSYADATMRGSAPGADATMPRWPADGLGEIGYAWMSTPTGAGPADLTVWHNGAAGGSTSFVGFDRASQRVVAVLSNTEASVDEIGMGLLGAATRDGGDGSPVQARELMIGVILPLFGAAAFLAAALGGWRRRPTRPGSRMEIVGAAGAVLFFLALAAGVGLPRWLVALVWPVTGALLGFGLAITVRCWPDLVWTRSRWLRPRSSRSTGR